jgi:NNP family nitrate/nitrite transporter-like MFS transporter
MATESLRRLNVLWLSTTAFTLLFAVWLMFGVRGVSIQRDFGLTDLQLGWLGAAALLARSLPRFLFGVWTDPYGGRRVRQKVFSRSAPQLSRS